MLPNGGLPGVPGGLGVCMPIQCLMLMKAIGMSYRSMRADVLPGIFGVDIGVLDR